MKVFPVIELFAKIVAALGRVAVTGSSKVGVSLPNSVSRKGSHMALEVPFDVVRVVDGH